MFNKKLYNRLVALVVLFCGVVIAGAMYFDKTNVILAFGFMLNALLIAWSKKC